MNLLDPNALLNTALERLSGTKCLVTGGTGFIGSHLIRRLSKVSDIEIRVLVSRIEDERVPSLPGVRPVAGRLLDEKALIEAVSGVDHVFHLAGLTRAKSEREFLRVNSEGTTQLAELSLVHAAGLRCFCHMSSLAAVGPSSPGEALDESAARRPITAYGRSKAAAEVSLESMGELPCVLLRPPAVYGPGEQDLFQLFQLVAKGVAPRIGLRERRYSFVHVNDVVNATLAVAVSQTTSQRTFFIAPDEIVTGLGFIQAIERALNRKAWKPPVPSPLLWLPALFGSAAMPFLSRPPLLNLDRWRDLTQRNWICDSGSLLSEVGYSCSFSIEEGVQQTVEWATGAGLLPQR